MYMLIQAMEFYLNPNDREESFMYITPDIIPNIKPWYLVSNKGNMYTMNKNRLMKQTISYDGYKVCTVRTFDGKGITVYIHRMEMMIFKYEPGCEFLDIDHVDCNKMNNNIENLEWVTTAENTRRAAINGLLLTGEDAPWTKVDNTKVHEICKLYVNGYGLSSIARIVQCGLDSVFRIVHGIGRRDISSQYDIESVYRNILTNDQIHVICSTISEFKHLEYSDIKPIIERRLRIRISRKIDCIIRCLYRHDVYCYYSISSMYEY